MIEERAGNLSGTSRAGEWRRSRLARALGVATRPRWRALGPAFAAAAFALSLSTAAAGAAAQQPPAPIEGQVCAECHPVDSLRNNAHRAEAACLSCHALDSHAQMPLDSAVAARQRSSLCAACHGDLVSSTHGHVAVPDAPVCTDCHRAHVDPDLSTAPALMAQRCGVCHDPELAEFLDGAHAASIAADDPNPDVPSCQTCHPPHDSAFVTRLGARLEATALCIRCHSDTLLIGSYDLPELASESYETDFHGATLRYLWNHPDGEDQPDVLVCSDCHGAHRVEWLAQDSVVAVCMDCHEAADERIAGAWLGHDRIGVNNAVIIWGIRLFYYSFVPIVLVGLLLNIVLDLRHQRRRRAAAPVHAHAHGAGKGIKATRFSVTERIEHFGAMTTFILLVITGLPQIWQESAAGEFLLRLWGGIGPARVIHRVTGVIFVGLMVLHVTKALVKWARTRKPPIMFVTRKDFEDTYQTVRNFLGLAAAPKVGKFDFRAKFEYWGLLMGGTLMSVTGIMLLFPEVVSWVLPGGTIAAGRVLHGLEGTFAVLVVLLWHSWSVILRPEVFPLDRTIFTGKMDIERMREEHPLEYERIFGVGNEAEQEEVRRG